MPLLGEGCGISGRRWRAGDSAGGGVALAGYIQTGGLGVWPGRRALPVVSASCPACGGRSAGIRGDPTGSLPVHIRIRGVHFNFFFNEAVTLGLASLGTWYWFVAMEVINRLIDRYAPGWIADWLKNTLTDVATRAVEESRRIAGTNEDAWRSYSSRANKSCLWATAYPSWSVIDVHFDSFRYPKAWCLSRKAIR